MRNRFIQNALYSFRIICGNNPILSKVYRLPFAKQGSLACSSSSLCMEGFPRSGNTFLLYIYRYWNKDRNICHHTYFPSQIINSVRMNKPCIVTIREPKDAVTSMLMRHPELSVDLALWNYISFYEAIRPHLSRIILAPYDQIMDNPSQIFASANKKFGCNITYGLYSTELRQKFLDKLYHRRPKHIVPNNYDSPDRDKISAKTETMQRVLASKRYKIAEGLYGDLTNNQANQRLGS